MAQVSREKYVDSYFSHRDICMGLGSAWAVDSNEYNTDIPFIKTRVTKKKSTKLGGWIRHLWLRASL